MNGKSVVGQVAEADKMGYPARPHWTDAALPVFAALVIVAAVAAAVAGVIR